MSQSRSIFCNNKTPLEFAFARQDYEMFEFLVAHGAMIIKCGISYFCIAARFQDQQAMDILKRYHEPNLEEEPVAIGLYRILKRSESIINATKFLIGNDIDITACDHNGENVIIHAIEDVETSEIRELLEFYRSVGVKYRLPNNWHPLFMYKIMRLSRVCENSRYLFSFLISDGFFEILDEDKMMGLLYMIHNFTWDETQIFMTDCLRSLVVRTKERFPDFIENIKLRHDYESFYEFLNIIDS